MRKIKINEELCIGCGGCVTDCAHSALRIVDGKAKLVNAGKCDGLGACIGACPVGALTIEEIPEDNNEEAKQWPLQLHLVSPQAPYLNNKELVVVSTCSPVASTLIHEKILKGRSVVIMCPKLDRTENYVQKLSEILKNNSIPKVIALIMQVPCCKGLSLMVQEALQQSGSQALFQEQIVNIDGSLK